MRDNGEGSRIEARRIMRLAWPIVLTTLSWTVMHLVDVVIVGRYGTEPLAAFAASRTLTFISLVIGYSGLAGVVVFVSRADGAGQVAETGLVLRAGLILGLALGLALALALFVGAEAMLGLVGVAEPLVLPGAAVVRAMVFAFPAQCGLAACCYFLEGISRPQRVLAVNLFILALNALLAWAMVGGHLGFAAAGAVGAARATAIASIAGMLVALWLCLTIPDAAARAVRRWSGADLADSLRRVAPLAWFGLVPALAAMLELAGFSWLMVLSTRLGSAAAGAFQIVLSIHNIAFALSMGFGSAAGVRVGNAVGEGRRDLAWPRTRIAAGLAAGLLLLSSVALAAAAGPVVWLFSSDGRVLALAGSMLAIFAAFLVFDGLQYVFGAALRSLGDQVWAGLNGIIGFFVVTGLAGWWFVARGWAGNGLALAAGLGMMVAALLQLARLSWLVRRSRK